MDLINDYHGSLSSAVGKSANDFERLGHTGRWIKSETITGGVETNFTGSNYGAGGIIVTTAGQTIYLSNGGSIPGTALALNVVHELSVSKVVSTSGTCYVLTRNPLIR